MFDLVSFSPAQKARAAIATLELASDDVKALDQLVQQTVLHPFVGPLIGLKATTLTELVEEVIVMGSDKERQSLLSDVAPLLTNARVRDTIAAGVVSIVKQMTVENQKVCYEVLKKFSEMPIQGIQGVKWRDEHHFISEGLLPVIYENHLAIKARKNGDLEDDCLSCPHCGMFIDDH